MRATQITAAAVGLTTLSHHVFASTLDKVHHLSTRDIVPNMPYDPATIKTCTWWYDNYLDLTCKDVRDLMYAISPEDFTRWNPSTSLDCDNWLWLSYCVQVKSEQPPHPSTSTIKKTTTTSAATPTATTKPQLLGWEELGCYMDDRTLSNKLYVSGDQLTVPLCEAACFSADFRYAGVKAGTECWCGVFVGNEWTSRQADCNAPCSGDSSQACGGTSVLSVFKALINDTLPSLSGATETTIAGLPTITSSISPYTTSATTSVATTSAANPTTTVQPNTGLARRGSTWFGFGMAMILPMLVYTSLA